MAFQKLSLKGRALRLLAQREHSRAELASKLARHVEEDDDLEAVLHDLQAKGFIDEARVAESLVHRRAARLGTQRLVQELRQKGIDDALIAAVMDEFSTERSETEENIRAILERKYPMAREDEKVRRRAVAALQRYGYGFDEIFSVLNSEE